MCHWWVIWNRILSLISSFVQSAVYFPGGLCTTWSSKNNAVSDWERNVANFTADKKSVNVSTWHKLVALDMKSRARFSRAETPVGALQFRCILCVLQLYLAGRPFSSFGKVFPDKPAQNWKLSVFTSVCLIGDSTEAMKLFTLPEMVSHLMQNLPTVCEHQHRNRKKAVHRLPPHLHQSNKQSL